MKRSEAVYQLAGYLSGFPLFQHKHPEELLGLAEHALEGVQKMGMAPPFTYNPVVIGTDGVTGEPAAIDLNRRGMNAWESEK